MERQLILASASPRRSQLLTDLGLCFNVVVSGVDEQRISADDPQQLVEKLAVSKASTAALQCPEALVIGADTVVVLDGKVYGKPEDELDAMHKLSVLNGKVHTVYTGVCVAHYASNRIETAVAATLVSMKPLTAQQISSYVSTGEPLDKAGAYAIQGLGATLIDRIEGCYFNVVGLPLSVLSTLLASFGVDLLAHTNVKTSR